MGYKAPNSTAVTWVSRVNGTSTVNQTVTSANTFVPFLSGSMSEFAFDTMLIGGSVSANFAGSTALFGNMIGSSTGLQVNPVNGSSITYTSPGNASPGVYMIEYGLTFGSIRGIVNFTAKLNGSVSATNIRTSIDQYISGSDGFVIQFREFVTVTTGGSPIILIWTVNGKNASSSDYWCTIAGPLTITQLG